MRVIPVRHPKCHRVYVSVSVQRGFSQSGQLLSLIPQSPAFSTAQYTFVSPCLYVTVAMCHRAFVSLYLCVTVSVCHRIYVSPCLCVCVYIYTLHGFNFADLSFCLFLLLSLSLSQ